VAPESGDLLCLSFDSDFFFEPKREAKSPDSFLLGFDCGGGGGTGAEGTSTAVGGSGAGVGSTRDLLRSRSDDDRESDFSVPGLGRSAKDADFFGLPLLDGFSFTGSSSDDVLKSRLQAPFLDCVGGGDGDGGGGTTGTASCGGSGSAGVTESDGSGGCCVVGNDGETGDFLSGFSSGGGGGGCSFVGERDGSGIVCGASAVCFRKGGRRLCRG